MMRTNEDGVCVCVGGGGGGGGARGCLRCTIFRLNTTFLHLLSSVTVDHNQFTAFKIPRFNPFDSSF